MAKSLKSFLAKKYPEAISVNMVTDVTYIDTRIPTLNYVISGKPKSGGIPLNGKIVCLYGPEACLSSQTYVQYCTFNKEKKCIVNHKGGTIERLYERFHDTITDGRSRKIDRNNLEFYINSIDTETNRIIRQVIADVVKTGKKECFEVVTEMGKKITATKDHKFYVGDGKFLALEELNIGDIVYIHNNTTAKFTDEQKAERKRTERKRKSIFVRYHPRAQKKLIHGKYLWYNCSRTYLVYEAYINGYTYDEYINLLNDVSNKKIIDNLKYLEKGMNIHHIDHNCENDVIENFAIMSHSDHAKYHSVKNIKNLSFIAIEDKIVSITYVGEKETYDIKCFEPHNNFIADGFVVHNSGKTSLILQFIREAQKKNIEVVFLDTERSITQNRARQFGIDFDKMIYASPDTMEECFMMIEDIYKEKADTGTLDEPIVIIWDSLAATPTNAEINRTADQVEIASQAGVLTRNLRRIRGKIKKMNAGVILIQQARANQDRYGDLFSMPGGYALHHTVDLILRVNKMKANESEMGVKISTPQKNRLFKPFQNTVIQFDYTNGFTKENIIVAFCEFLRNIEILGSAGAWCYLQTDVIDIMKQDPSLTEKEAKSQVKKFYLKDFASKLVDDENYFNEMLEVAEDYVNKNISKVAKIMIDDEVPIDVLESNPDGIEVEDKEFKEEV